MSTRAEVESRVPVASTAVPVEEAAAQPDGVVTAPAHLAPLLDQLAALDAEVFDSYAVTALLESTGLRDVDARDRYGAADMFALGGALFPAAPPRAEEWQPLSLPATSPRGLLRAFVGRYTNGLAYVVPIAAQVATFIALGYSLFASSGFSVTQATVVALATLASLLVTAPAVQGIARRGNHYLNLQNERLVRLAMEQMTALGAVLTLLVGLLIALPWALAGGEELGRFLGYYGLLSLLWMAIARVDICRMRWLVSPASIAAVVAVFVLHEYGGRPISHAQWFGLALLNLGLLLAAQWRLRRWERDLGADVRRMRLLPVRALAARLWPLFAYGVLYYAFLFTDRIIAWTTAPLPEERVIVFRSDYEAGLAWALLLLFLCTSVLEYTIRAFSQRLIPTAGALPAGDDQGFARTFRRFYARQALLLAGVSFLSLAAGYAALLLMPEGGARWATFRQPVVERVFLTAGAGYLLFNGGLFSAIFLQSLSRGVTVVRWLLVAVLVNAVSGFTAAHAWGYEWAALGVVAGGAVFAALCALSTLRLFRRGPYHLAATLA